MKPTKKQIAAAIGVSQPMVSKYVRQGMPCWSIEAAVRWREQHIDPYRRKEFRAYLNGSAAAAPPPPEPVADLGRVDLLFAACRQDFDRWAPELRAAMRAVPHRQRAEVKLDIEVVRRLVADVLALMPGEPVEDMSDGDAAYMGDLWYSAAAGEIAAVGAKIMVSPAAAHLFDD